jgi:hypothetical protein
MTITLEHLNIKELPKYERAGAVKNAIMDGLGALEHGVHRRVEIDIDDLWTLLDTAQPPKPHPTIEKAKELLQWTSEDNDLHGEYVEDAELFNLRVGTEFLVENGGWDGRIVLKDGVKHLHILATGHLMELVKSYRSELNITITKGGFE